MKLINRLLFFLCALFTFGCSPSEDTDDESPEPASEGAQSREGKAVERAQQAVGAITEQNEEAAEEVYGE